MKYLALVLGSVMLVACGGGGTSSAVPTVTVPTVVIDPNLTVPFQTAVANLVNNGFSKTFTISGWIDESTISNPRPPTQISGSGTFTAGPPSAGTLNGASVLAVTQVITGSQTANGQSAAFSATGILYFNSSNYTLAGTAAGGVNTLISAHTYPATVKAGSTGSLGNGTTGRVLPTTSTFTYSVTSDSATSLLVTFIESTYFPLGGNDQTQTVYRVDTSGKITPVSTTIQRYSSGTLYKSLAFTF